MSAVLDYKGTFVREQSIKNHSKNVILNFMDSIILKQSSSNVFIAILWIKLFVFRAGVCNMQS